MKVLFDHNSPFSLTHGGFQVQIEQTKAGLEEAGVEVEYLRWWDDRQSGDIIHYFGRPWQPYTDAAHKRGCKIVLADLLTGLGSRSALERTLQKWIMASARKFLPREFTTRMAWDAFQRADACVAAPWEAQLIVQVFGARPEKVHVLLNGVEDVFQHAPQPRERSPWLICTATVDPRKRVLELARACVLAQVPIKIIGKPYSEADPYARDFASFAREHSKLILYEGPVYDRRQLAQLYTQARGFVLLSTMESLSLSAGEATACGCPLLLSDLPWARMAYGASATYCPVRFSATKTAKQIREFYEQAPKLPLPPRPPTWLEIGRQLKSLYHSLLNSSA